MINRESVEVDVLIVGGGPSGLSLAIHLKNLNPDITIALIDKGDAIGDHILSGAVLEPRALNELIPNWQSLNFPLHTPVISDRFLWLTKQHAFRLPTPKPMQNHGNFIISLSECCRFLTQIAEQQNVLIFPSTAGVEILFAKGRVIGVRTGDKGVDKEGQPKENFAAGVLLLAKQTILAEGCRGSLTKQIVKHFHLDHHVQPQTYALGIKELWEVPSSISPAGSAIHTVGWPLTNQTYGGSFIYSLSPTLLAIGFVVGLDYQNPYLSPFEEFQRFKTHPHIRTFLQSGNRIAYGARTLSEGGFQSLPKLTFPGGMIIGDAGGFLNVPKIKGIHMAMKSGMIAAEALHRDLLTPENPHYFSLLKKSWLWEELYRVRNIRPGMQYGLKMGLLYAALDTYIFRGKAPFTLKHRGKDAERLVTLTQSRPIFYQKPDQLLTFDIASSLYLANIKAIENQPCHLKIRNSDLFQENLKQFGAPETRYCPANVYEVHNNDLQINANNCIHCKACDIKDPLENIEWTPPEGGTGPQYRQM